MKTIQAVISHLPARRCLTVGLALLAGSLGDCLPPGKSAWAAETTKRIMITPPLQWDSDMAAFRPALHQTATDFGYATGGMLFGMTAPEVNQLLPDPAPGLTWAGLPPANEYPEEIRYFWVRMDGARTLRPAAELCGGSESHIVFLFRARGLFRLSYRFVPDEICPDVTRAVDAVFDHYTRLGLDIARSVHYRNGRVEVVDITDPAATYLIPIRWRAGGR
jgi:hypothetical protein